MDSTERFSDRVSDYVRYRPGYPRAVLDALREVCGLSAKAIVGDIGAGTGKLSRLFLENGNSVYGVEPNREMREAGVRGLAEFERFHVSGGSAEDTGLDDGSVDLIIAGQAFHWFEPVGTRREFERILRPHGWVVIVFNTRVASLSPFMESYESVVGSHAESYDEVGQGRRGGKKEIEEFFSPSQISYRNLSNHQTFAFQELTGRFFSSSYAPRRDTLEATAAERDLAKLFEEHQRDGTVRFDYRTELYFGRLH